MESTSKLWKKSEDVVFNHIEGECILLNLGTGDYYTLNEVGRFLWEFMDGRTSVADMCRKVVDYYDVEPEQAREDVEHLLRELHREQLIVPSP